MLQIERENTEMRSKLGLTYEDVVYVTDTLLKEKKQTKFLHELHKKVTQLEEENLSLHLEIQTSGKTTDTAQISKTKADTSLQTQDKKQTPADAYLVNAETHKAVVEENEALRKGLHEILSSLQTRAVNGLREIRSETLEQLLRALDVKHISGWYHPAMRLQAELHVLQGSNLELREQLKNTRIELEISRKSTDNEPVLQIPSTIDLTSSLINSSLNFDVVSNLHKHLMQVMKENEIITQKNTLLTSHLEKYQLGINTIEQQITLFYKQYSTEKSEWCKGKETFSKTTNEVTEKVEILENKLKDISKYVNKSNDKQAKLKQVSEMSGTIVILNRKLLHFENENTKLVSELKIVKQDLLYAEIAVKKNINNLRLEKNFLTNQLRTLKIEGLNGINVTEHKKLLNDFDNLTLKHRSLLNNLAEICSQNDNEITLMKASIDLLKKEKEEL
ncbi:hypothetical protein AMK59_4417 [Oryctes borbonicus]|uniref:Uncharacterized protein n=1 Tax=Oryctes borbonicus TaxID=1629725 RepID=A0A0T6B5S3_9SCAR|nr:hypothetical protein AMK59_4417 [Oryctes borbonicus]